MKMLIQLLIAVLIITAGILIRNRLIATKPEAEKVEITQALPVVEVLSVKKVSEPIRIKTQGEVTPPKRTTLSAQVLGKVISVSDKYKIGETFSRGEIILTVEDTDYRTAVVNAKASKTQAEAALKESRGSLDEAKSALEDARVTLTLEETRVEQAKRDWAKLGEGKPASDLLLRKPQIQAAKAKITAAEARITAIEGRIEANGGAIEQAQANIERAQRDLERTRIRAPYPCQVESKQIDLGALVTVGMPLATVYETGSAEVRLPIALEDLSYVKIGAPITATAEFGSDKKEWTGKISRSENRIDPATRTAYVIAQFTGENVPPIGLFTEVSLAGKELSEVFPVPRIALRGEDQVIIVQPDQTITFRTVKVERTSEKMVFISEGLEEGEQVCTTVMSTPIEGIKVEVATLDGEREVEDSQSE